MPHYVTFHMGSTVCLCTCLGVYSVQMVNHLISIYVHSMSLAFKVSLAMYQSMSMVTGIPIFHFTTSNLVSTSMLL